MIIYNIIITNLMISGPHDDDDDDEDSGPIEPPEPWPGPPDSSFSI